jgi:hypothetical protein
MNIPRILSIDNALKVYYTYSEIGNKEITALFGRCSSATICKLKRAVKEEMIRRDIPRYCANSINTAVAFEVWGIDVKDLEKRMKKIKELDFR